MKSPIETLPSATQLSPSIFSFLNDNLTNSHSLAGAPVIVSDLQSQRSDLDRTLSDLNRRLASTLFAYASFSARIHSLLAGLNQQFSTLRSTSFQDVGGEEGSERSEQILGEELSALAKEVARVETIRLYAETALKLDTLIGDTEYAASSTMMKNLKKRSSVESQDMRQHAIKTLKHIEDILCSITKTHPQWGRLVSAVDHRVDRALAVLRPQAIADHRALLASLGWPPPLSSITNSIKLQNPLFTMQGDLKLHYCENFVALCSLQELQRRRKSRQLEGYSKEASLHQPLWVIEELVNPIALACQSHFSKWVENPEFIFALVYKITRDYVDSMDELLQPQIDEAMLSGYSCREEWISGMVLSLSTYLAKEIFPKYVAQLREENKLDTLSQAKTSWLHLIDLMISFDKQIKSLLEHSGISVSFQEYGNTQNFSSLAVFQDRPDWLDLWAEIELGEILDKLSAECNKEKNWTRKFEGEAISSDPEDFKAPIISGVFLRYISSVIDRSRSLPNTNIGLRWKFLRSTGAPLVQKFLDYLLLRCQEAEGLTALTDNDAIIKVAISINAAHNMESVLKQWFEDIFFLEIGSVQVDKPDMLVRDSGSSELFEDPDDGILNSEIRKLEVFRLEWVEKISVVTLRGFDSLCRDYMKNKRQWQEKSEDSYVLSKSLVGALDYLRLKISVLEVNLNGKDFVGVWRSLAAAIDRLFFGGILLSNVKFNDGGVERFGRDMEVLFGVFRAWCLRPEGFFPKVTEGLKLLKMSENQLRASYGREKWMDENRIKHLSIADVDRIVKSRLFTS